MTGGSRLLWILAFVLLLSALLWTEDGSAPTTAQGGPPKAKVQPVEDSLHGHKVTDPYRYLEDSANPATRQFVEQELAYTRSLLDPLPGREKLHHRLSELLQVG